MGYISDRLGLRSWTGGTAYGQPFKLGVAKALLKAFGDPDWAFFEQLADGVPTGAGVTMPRTPEVFEAKTKWALDEDVVGEKTVVENYQSLSGFEKQVKDLFEEEGRLGWMLEMTHEEGDNMETGSAWHLYRW